jgi:hypothetical protein
MLLSSAEEIFANKPLPGAQIGALRDFMSIPFRRSCLNK